MPDGSVVGSGLLTATLSTTPNVYDVTAITGTWSDTYGVSGAANNFVTGSGTSADGLWIYDDLLFMSPTVQFIDNTAGWLFDVGGTEVNLWGNGEGVPGDYTLGTTINGNPVYSGQTLDLSVSPTPEPSSLMLFVTGMLGLGGMIRRKLQPGK